MCVYLYKKCLYNDLYHSFLWLYDTFVPLINTAYPEPPNYPIYVNVVTFN